MKEIYNFATDAAMLPAEVMRRVQEELSDARQRGLTMLETGRAAERTRELTDGAEKLLRELLGIPQNYKVMFLPGGTSAQYSAIPLNFLSDHRCADYIVSGQRSKQAYLEAKRYGDMVIAASSAGANPLFSTVPTIKRSDFRPDADYVYMCYNNEIYGTKFHEVPDTGNIPLVADMTSCLLSEPVDIKRFGMVYGGSELSFSTTGLTVAIVRNDLIGNARPDIPSILDYRVLSDRESIYNTPPVFALYIAKLALEYMSGIGGLPELKRRNERKASLLYDYLDGQGYYAAMVDKKSRSMTNVVFTLGSGALDAKFVAEARTFGLYNLAGHPSIGGINASIYNAMPHEGVEALVEFMKKFCMENPKMEI